MFPTDEATKKLPVMYGRDRAARRYTGYARADNGTAILPEMIHGTDRKVWAQAMQEALAEVAKALRLEVESARERELQVFRDRDKCRAAEGPKSAGIRVGYCRRCGKAFTYPSHRSVFYCGWCEDERQS
ncbi:hypothetical protein CMI37_22715 [Candidatus Pacearchaeota archaeon]|nr:hypothetical protein [Candidatus Pacearchaeota archaeon]